MTAIVGGVLAVLVIAGGTAAVVLGGGAGGTTAADGSPTSAAATPTAALPRDTVLPPVPTAASTPADALQQRLDGDADTVESLVGWWVPQLSSKREGDVVDGTRYDAAAVLTDFETWQARVPSSVLTRSERFTSFRGQRYWVTLAAEPFATAEEANAWCVAQDLGRDDCFAKRLSHTEGPDGNTRPR